MDLWFDIIVKKGYLMDAIGVMGLGLLGLASVRLSQRYRSWGGSLLASGSLLLLLGRLWVLVSPQLLTAELRQSMGSTANQLVSLAPMTLLTLGLAAVVWGLWGHEQWLREER